jgi:hypothetical protein
MTEPIKLTTTTKAYTELDKTGVKVETKIGGAKISTTDTVDNKGTVESKVVGEYSKGGVVIKVGGKLYENAKTGESGVGTEVELNRKVEVPIGSNNAKASLEGGVAATYNAKNKPSALDPNIVIEQTDAGLALKVTAKASNDQAEVKVSGDAFSAGGTGVNLNP